MTSAEVERRIGTPVAQAEISPSRSDARRLYHATLYAFSAVPGRFVEKGRAHIRLAELRFADGRLVAIDNAPGASIFSDRCAPHVTPDPSDVDVFAAAGPLLQFSGVSVGSPYSSLHDHFGRNPSCNRPKDWCSYLPVPIAFGVDADRGTVGGFSVARDDDALTVSAEPELHIRRDPTTCRLLSISFALQSR